MLDMTRHVGPSAVAFTALEYPNEVLKLPLLKFNQNAPKLPLVMHTDGELNHTVLTSISSYNLLPQYQNFSPC
jgi:hypothetical protein